MVYGAGIVIYMGQLISQKTIVSMQLFNNV